MFTLSKVKREDRRWRSNFVSLPSPFNRIAGRVEQIDADLAGDGLLGGDRQPDGDLELLVLEGGEHARLKRLPAGFGRCLPSQRRRREAAEQHQRDAEAANATWMNSTPSQTSQERVRGGISLNGYTNVTTSYAIRIDFGKGKRAQIGNGRNSLRTVPH